jgi:low temperature requirement protein LtrA
MELVTPFVTGVGEFTVGVGHFVERHGLAVIIVLGESITAVGAATSRESEVGTAIVGAPRAGAERGDVVAVLRS